MFTNAELHQLLKMPVLFQHYQEHKEQDKDISFWSFIRMHYFSKPVIDGDYQRDQQLPMKDADTCQIIVKTICECEQPADDLSVPVNVLPVIYGYTGKNKVQSRTVDIFQPPRQIC